MTIVATDYQVSSFGPTPRSFTITAPASGNSLILMFDPQTKTGPSCDDNQSNTYTLDYTGIAAPQALFYRANNITNSPTQIDFGWSSGGDATIIMWLYEVENLAASPFMDSGEDSAAPGTSVSPIITPTANNGIGICCVRTQDAKDITATGTNAVRTNTGSNTLNGVHSTDLETGNSIGGSWTGSTNCDGTMVGYELSAAAGTEILMGQSWV